MNLKSKCVFKHTYSASPNPFGFWARRLGVINLPCMQAKNGAESSPLCQGPECAWAGPANRNPWVSFTFWIGEIMWLNLKMMSIFLIFNMQWTPFWVDPSRPVQQHLWINGHPKFCFLTNDFHGWIENTWQTLLNHVHQNFWQLYETHQYCICTWWMVCIPNLLFSGLIKNFNPNLAFYQKQK